MMFRLIGYLLTSSSPN